MVRVVHAAVELNGLLIQTIDLLDLGHSALQCRFYRQIKQNLEIWLEPIRCQLLRLDDGLFLQTSRTPLIRKRRVAESVRDDK